MEREFLEKCLARRMSLRQIGELVGREESTISYHLKKHGLKPFGYEKYAARGGLAREALKRLVDEGATLSEMADELDRSISTVRHWLRRYGLKTTGGRRWTEMRAARAAGIRRVKRKCRNHGLTEFILEARGYYRCVKCRSERVSEWCRRAKRRLIQSGGGACALCGYDKYPGALQFHHHQPAEKQFAISREGVTRAFAEAEAEAAKCVLLCANCHAEVEGGYTALRN